MAKTYGVVKIRSVQYLKTNDIMFLLHHSLIARAVKYVEVKKKMTKELTEEFAFCLGYELIYRNDRFILEGTGIPSIKGRIIDGIKR